jgi:hypothetical protein
VPAKERHCNSETSAYKGNTPLKSFLCSVRWPTLFRRQAAKEEWDQITEEEISRLVDSMPERIEAVIAASGGHTRWKYFIYVFCFRFCLSLLKLYYNPYARAPTKETHQPSVAAGD